MSLPQFAIQIKQRQYKINISPKTKQHITVNSQLHVKTTCAIIWLLFVTPTILIKEFSLYWFIRVGFLPIKIAYIMHYGITTWFVDKYPL